MTSACTPSPYQVAIYKKVRQHDENILVEAGAGSGKTTTCVASLDFLPPGSSTCLIAFNVPIAKEFGERVDGLNRERVADGESRLKVDCSTINSVGAKILYRSRMGKLDKRKLWGITKSVVPFNKKAMSGAVQDLVRGARTHGMVPKGLTERDLNGVGLGLPKGLIEDTDAEWIRIARRYEISFHADAANNKEPAYRQTTYEEISMAREVLRRSILACRAQIDFDDQIYLPVVFQLPFPRYDNVIVDEAQDLSDLNFAFVQRLGSWFMFVGDAKQSLYAFRGADSNAMDRIVKEFNCVRLPLSITYRCAKSIVRYANQFDPTLEPREGAPEGEVVDKGDGLSAPYEKGDMVVSRFNAVLLKLAYRLIARGVPVRMQGRDIGSKILDLMDTVGGGTPKEVIANCDAYVTRQVMKLGAAEDDGALMSLLDNVQSLLTILIDGNVDHLWQMPDVVKHIFDPDVKNVVLLSSIHRAKGLEADRVWWINPTLTTRCTTPDQVKQENNAKNVAATRAKTSLFLVRIGKEQYDLSLHLQTVRNMIKNAGTPTTRGESDAGDESESGESGEATE